MYKEKIKLPHLADIIHELRIGLAEARLTLTSVNCPIPIALKNATDEDPFGKIRRLFDREKRQGKKEYARGYADGYREAVDKFVISKLPPRRSAIAKTTEAAK